MPQAAAPEGAQLPADAVEVGRIVDAWGIRGGFRVQPYSASPEALFSCREWFLLPPERGAAGFSAVRALSVRNAREHGGGVVAHAAGVADRSAAEALRGARVFVARSSFPTPAEDEYYWVDLLGLAVVNREGIALGTVRELLSTGPQTVLVIEAPAEPGEKPRERMIPFVSAFIDTVDLAGRCIRVDWSPDY